MVTGETKNKVDRIWDSFWTGGITNPLTVIEQLTYMLFIKQLDDKQLTSEKEASILGIEPKIIFDKDNEDLRWSNFKHFDAEKMYHVISTKVFPFIKNINGEGDTSYARYMEDAIFTIPSPRM